MAVSYNPKMVTDGLVLYLDAGNRRSYIGSGTTWNDVSGNNVIGTLTNGPTFDSTFLGNVTLDGTNDYVDVPMQFTPVTFTMSIWILLSSTVGSSNIFAMCSKEGVNSGFGLNILGSSFGNFNSQLEFFIGNGSGVNTVRNNTAAILTNTWYNFVGVYAGSTVSLYQNGSFINSGACSTISYSNNNFNVGRSAEFLRYTPSKNGIVTLHTRTLSATEILQNFNATRGRFGV